jgi:hypothetical protein
MFGGSQKAQLKLQYERNLLLTLARALKVDRCMTDPGALYLENWKAWLARESRIRLVHCMFRECSQREVTIMPETKLTFGKNSSASNLSYSVASRFSGSTNLQRSSPAVRNYGGVNFPALGSPISPATARSVAIRDKELPL